MKILGIDADSKKIALVCFEDDRLLYHELLISHAKNTNDRLYDLIIIFEGQIKAIKPNITYLEESIFIQNYKTSRAISEVIGNIKFILRENDIPFETVPVNSWKKVIVGKGNASKDEVREFTENIYPELKGEIQDTMDACCVCLYGIRVEQEKRILEKDGDGEF